MDFADARKRMVDGQLRPNKVTDPRVLEAMRELPREAFVPAALRMRAYADEGDVVFEPFAGAGTTVIAGQRTTRRVRAIELAPAYVDLAVARWRMLHPDMPVTLADDGRDYDAVAAARTEVNANAA